MKRTLASLLLIIMASVGIHAQVEGSFEYNGLYYVMFRETLAKPTFKPDGSGYSGTVTIPNDVTAPDGKTYEVYKIILDALFKNAEALTVDMIPYLGPDAGVNYRMNLNLSSAKNLTSIRFNHLANEIASINTQYVNMGNNPGCVYFKVLPGQEENLIKVETFNLYGPDGKQLRPALRIESSGEFVYPDDNNTFHLDQDLKYNGQSVNVFYYMDDQVKLFYYGVAENGEFMYLTSTPYRNQTGLEATVEGIRYSIAGDEAFIAGVDSSDALPENVSIPSVINYEGAAYPVTTVQSKAFDSGFTAKSIKFPVTVTKIMGSTLFNGCPNLERVDMSAITYTDEIKTLEFYNCPALKEVIWPKKLTKMAHNFISCASLEDITIPSSVTELTFTFSGCAALRNVTIPKSVTIMSNTFGNCPNLRNVVVPALANIDNISENSGLIEMSGDWTSDEEYKLNITHFGISTTDGSVDYYPYTVTYDYSNKQYMCHQAGKEGDDYIFKKEAFYQPDRNPDKPASFQPKIYIGIYEKAVYGTYMASEPTANVSTVADEENIQPRYFNLQGIEVNESNLRRGIYIRVQGKTSEKILIQ